MNTELLYAYLDGELDSGEAARLEARLAADPALVAELAALRQIDAALDALPGHEVTDAVRRFRRNWLGPRAATPGPVLHRHCPVCRRAFAFESEFCRLDGAALQITPIR